MSAFLRRHGWAIVLGVLVAVNAVLIALLVIRFDHQTATTAQPPISAPSDVSGGPESKSPTPSASDKPTPDGSSRQPPTAPAASDHRRVIAADSENVAWRTVSEGCDTPATVEVTTDGGRTWRRTDPGIRSIVRLKAFGTHSVFAIGADAQCRPTYAWTDGPDKKWQRDSSLISDKWFRVPNDRNQVHDTHGGRSKPCGDGLVDLAGLGTYQAAVLCNDGRIRTRDQGRGWRTVVHHSHAVALNADDIQFVAAVNSPGCQDGMVIRTFDVNGDGLSSGSGQCRKAPRAGSDGVGVSNIWSTVWLWSGHNVSVGP